MEGAAVSNDVLPLSVKNIKVFSRNAFSMQ